MLAEMLITSALNREAASSNDVRVRVLGSTKKFTSVFPRSAGTFLISRVPTCLKASAVSRIRLISSRGQLTQSKQVFAVPARAHSFNNQTASGSSSVCSSRTRTFSLAALGRFLPT